MSWLRWVRRAVTAIVVFAVLIFVATVGRVWWQGTQDDRPRSDVLVVLGAAQYNGKPSPVYRARLDHAAALFKDGVAPRVITVGGNRQGDRTTEGASGAAYLRKNDVPDGAVHAIESGSNTYRSLQDVHALMVANGWRSAVVVTDPWHALRARTMAADLGIDAHVSPVENGPVADSDARYIAKESVGYLCYAVFGGRCSNSDGS